VLILPSQTNKRLSSTLAVGAMACSSAQSVWCVVHKRPSSKPARAAIKAPEQIQAIGRWTPATRFSQSTVWAISGVSPAAALTTSGIVPPAGARAADRPVGVPEIGLPGLIDPVKNTIASASSWSGSLARLFKTKPIEVSIRSVALT
jgi:hypothetical protein